jgi:sugar phosphate isomerase/epimerase
MLRVISTHVFLRQRLHPGLLDALSKGRAQGIELFAARQHFNYANRTHVQEIAAWFRDNPVEAFSMHMPIFADGEGGRGGVPAVNVIHPDKARRIEGMDEVRRTLEAAEVLPVKFLILHIGEREDSWSQRTLEHAMTAIEHLKAFARPLGVKLLLENIRNEITRPENLLQILTTGHFNDVGLCLDLGHAHMGEGVVAAIAELKPRIFSTHIHDNHGLKDEHLWPGEGTIDWKEAMGELRTSPQLAGAVLEIQYLPEEAPDRIGARAQETFRMLDL